MGVLLTAAYLEFETDETLTYEVNFVNLAAKEQKTSSHMALHPFGKVPAVEMSGLPFYETDAIIQLFAHVKPEAGLIPPDPLREAKMHQLLSVYSSYFDPAYKPIYKELVLKKRYDEGPPDLERVRHAERRTAEVLEIIDQEFDGGPKGYFL